MWTCSECGAKNTGRRCTNCGEYELEGQPNIRRSRQKEAKLAAKGGKGGFDWKQLPPIPTMLVVIGICLIIILVLSLKSCSLSNQIDAKDAEIAELNGKLAQPAPEVVPPVVEVPVEEEEEEPVEEKEPIVEEEKEEKPESKPEKEEKEDDGTLTAKQKGSLWGFVNNKGEWVIEAKYPAVKKYWRGLAAVCMKTDRGNLWGYVDGKGKTVIDPQFDDAGSFNVEGKAKVEMEGKLYYINRSGEVVGEV